MTVLIPKQHRDRVKFIMKDGDSQQRNEILAALVKVSQTQKRVAVVITLCTIHGMYMYLERHVFPKRINQIMMPSNGKFRDGYIVGCNQAMSWMKMSTKYHIRSHRKWSKNM